MAQAGTKRAEQTQEKAKRLLAVLSQADRLREASRGCLFAPTPGRLLAVGKYTYQLLTSLCGLDETLPAALRLPKSRAEKLQALCGHIRAGDAAANAPQLDLWSEMVAAFSTGQVSDEARRQICKYARGAGPRPDMSNLGHFCEAAHEVALLLSRHIQASASTMKPCPGPVLLRVLVSRLNALRDYIILNSTATGPYVMNIGGIWDPLVDNPAPRSGVLHVSVDFPLTRNVYLRFVDNRPNDSYYDDVEHTSGEYPEEFVGKLRWRQGVHSFSAYMADVFRTWQPETGLFTHSQMARGVAKWVVNPNLIVPLLTEIRKCLAALLRYPQARVIAQPFHRTIAAVLRSAEAGYIKWTFIRNIDAMIDRAETMTVPRGTLRKIRVFLDDFYEKDTGSYPFLNDLLHALKTKDGRVSYREKKHGPNQPKMVKDMLRETSRRTGVESSGLEQLAKSIKRVPGGGRRYKIDLPPDDVDVVPRSSKK